MTNSVDNLATEQAKTRSLLKGVRFQYFRIICSICFSNNSMQIMFKI